MDIEAFPLWDVTASKAMRFVLCKNKYDVFIFF